ncbi:centromere protein T isoform X1 [Falco biarmicus]|uniref:centromere protein T isoform X3 n=1 Tax=Falco rusticolus TaxID=120794 RepID=UPI0018869D2F|nr:centromere protein T isoform X3 [Falco rusticolus]XP_055582778.1 centromere protein T isoform X1 [Falco cherrug]XP_055674819.1 centromere protein T isoform X1 [Falco peregrinus]XP_056216998.1 centromere protein T isoform X1 [Falco biarmicus]
MEQPVLLANLLTELGLGQAQAADAALHLLHLHLQQRNDVALLIQLPQQLLRRGARRQRVRVVRGAALHRALLPHRRREPPGAGPSGRPGPELHLHRQVDGLHIFGRAPCRGLGGGGSTGALGGGGSSSGGGAGAAGGPLRLALVDAAQREYGGDPHQNIPGSGKDKNSGRSTLVKQRPAVFPDLDNDTPRNMLKRIIQTQPQVSPLALRISKHEETEGPVWELPAKRISNMGEMQLPDLVPEDASIATFRMTKKRRKISVSEFERAADERLPQNQARSTLDSSTALARSLSMSLGTVIPPDTVEKRGLLRRPKNRRAIDIEAFEGGVEQNMLKRKAQKYLVDSQTASEIQTTVLTSDVEIMLSNTELFVQPQFDDQSQNKLSVLEPQLLNSKTSAQRSKISDAAQEETRLVGTDTRRTPRNSENLILDHEHAGRMTPLSPGTPANQQEDKHSHSQQSNPMKQLSVSEEVAVGTAEHHANAGYSEDLEKTLREKGELQITVAQDARAEPEVSSSEEGGIAEGSVEHPGSPKAEHEITKSVGGESLDRHSHTSSSEKSGMKLLKEAVEQADELEDQAIKIELDGMEEGPTEDEAEDPESEGDSMKTPTFVRAVAYKPLLSTPHPAKPAAPKLSAPRPAKPAAARSPQQPLQANRVPKGSGVSQRKTSEPEIASSLIKKIFSHYVKMPVARDALKIVQKCSEKYFMQLSNDLEAYIHHAGRKTVEMEDLEVLMRRQGLVTDKMPLHVLIERYFPLEYRKLLIPVAASGNKVIPSK